jgi:hypothetical protein
MLHGPTFKDVDISVSRAFSLSHFREGMNIQLRADAYNVFNIVSLNPPLGMAQLLVLPSLAKSFGERHATIAIWIAFHLLKPVQSSTRFVVEVASLGKS